MRVYLLCLVIAAQNAALIAQDIQIVGLNSGQQTLTSSVSVGNDVTSQIITNEGVYLPPTTSSQKVLGATSPLAPLPARAFTRPTLATITPSTISKTSNKNLITLEEAKSSALSVAAASSGSNTLQAVPVIRRTSIVNSAVTANTEATAKEKESSRNVIPAEIVELKELYERMKIDSERRLTEIKQMQPVIAEQIKSWYFKSPEIQSAMEEALNAAAVLLETSQTYISGGEKLIAAMEGVTSGLERDWTDKVRKLSNLAEIAVNRSFEIMQATQRMNADILEDHKIYQEAKARKTVEVKGIMDDELHQLLEQTLQIGQHAANTLEQSKKEWASILRTQLGSEKATSAIARLDEITASTLEDLRRLTPEDIESTMNDAHHCIEDVKGLMYANNIPAGLIRQGVNPVLMAIFTTVNRAKSIHSQREVK